MAFGGVNQMNITIYLHNGATWEVASATLPYNGAVLHEI